MVIAVVRGFRDRDYVETQEGLIFAVIGNTHPKDRVIAYLKYVIGSNTEKTIWFKQGVPYRRVMPLYSASNVREVINDYLRNKYPEYVVFDKYRNIELVEIPRSKIKVHYKPEERLREILEKPRDPLEELVRDMVDELSSASGVPKDYFGVTGSILLGIHNPQYSDIDLIVYGVSNALKVRNSMGRLYANPASGFSRFDDATLRRWAMEVAETQAFTVEEAEDFYRRYVWNRGLFRGRKFSIHPVKLEGEVNEEWERTIHRPICVGTVKARVVDSGDSLFMPATYIVEDVKFLDNCKTNAQVKQIVSYESLYIDLAQPGDEVIARGKLEEVIDTKTNEVYGQVVVGTYEARGKDFIKPTNFLKVGTHDH